MRLLSYGEKFSTIRGIELPDDCKGAIRWAWRPTRGEVVSASPEALRQKAKVGRYGYHTCDCDPSSALLLERSGPDAQSGAGARVELYQRRAPASAQLYTLRGDTGDALPPLARSW